MHRALYFAYIYNPPPLSLAKIFHSFLPFSFFFSFFLSTRNIEDDFSAIRVIIIGFVIHAFLVLVSRVKEDERTPGSERGKEGRKEGRKGFSWEVGAGEQKTQKHSCSRFSARGQGESLRRFSGFRETKERCGGGKVIPPSLVGST